MAPRAPPALPRVAAKCRGAISHSAQCLPCHPVPPRTVPCVMSCALPPLCSTHTLVMRQGQRDTGTGGEHGMAVGLWPAGSETPVAALMLPNPSHRMRGAWQGPHLYPPSDAATGCGTRRHNEALMPSPRLSIASARPCLSFPAAAQERQHQLCPVRCPQHTQGITEPWPWDRGSGGAPPMATSGVGGE